MSSNIKYIGLDVHKDAISIAVLNGAGKLVIESIIETKAATLVQFLQGLRGELVQTQPRFVVRKTTPLPVKGVVANATRGSFDITPDGKYFVVLLPNPRSEQSSARPDQQHAELV